MCSAAFCIIWKCFLGSGSGRWVKRFTYNYRALCLDTTVDCVPSSLPLQRGGEGQKALPTLVILLYSFKFAPRAGAMFSQICLPVVFLSIIILFLNHGRDLRVNRRAQHWLSCFKCCLPNSLLRLTRLKIVWGLRELRLLHSPQRLKTIHPSFLLLLKGSSDFPFQKFPDNFTTWSLLHLDLLRPSECLLS